MKDFLSQSDFFGDLPAEDLARIAEQMILVRLTGGQTLFREGDAADSLFIVKGGRLRVLRTLSGGGYQTVAELGRGEVVGEFALLTGNKREGTVIAVRDTELLRLPKAGFDVILDRFPKLAVKLARNVLLRVASTARKATGGGSAAIALLPLTPGLPVGEIAGRLGAALGSAGKTLILDVARIKAELGENWERRPHGEIIEWLEKQEADCRYLLYACNSEPSAFIDLAVRQADRLLLMAHVEAGASHPVAPATVAAVEQAHGVKELVLIHRESRRNYPGTGPWLATWPCSRHHHVVWGAAESVERVARFVTGRTRGLVFGGGGARGFAHIGVARALAEANMPIDMVGGTSMGAFIGSLFALGLDWKEMRDFNEQLWRRASPLKDATLPLLGLVRGRRFLRIAGELFGRSHIEDLALNYFCVVANLTKAEAVAPPEGPLLRWIAASMSIPGIASPTFHRGDLYVDGGVLNNIPIDIMRRRCEGQIIAVDVTPREDLAVDPRLVSPPPTWRILLSRLNIGAERIDVPSVFDILSRTTSVSSIAALEVMKPMADLYLQPPIDPFGLLEFHRIDEIIEAGYRFAVEGIKTLR